MKNILIFGGVDPFGRSMALHALREGDYETIRVVDRIVPEVSFFPPWDLKLFCKLEVYHMDIGSANLDSRKIDQAFSLPEGQRWDLVIHGYYHCHLHGTAKVREALMPDHVEYLVNRARLIGEGAVRYGSRLLIYITRTSLCRWTPKMGRFKDNHVLTAWRNNIRSEGEISMGMVLSLALREAPNPSFSCFYEESDRLDTIHVEDATRAVFHAAHWYIQGQHEGVRTFNVSDDKGFSLKEQLHMICQVFNIPCRDLPRPMRALAKRALKIGWLTDILIKRCQDDWITILNEDGITSTPIDYILDHEVLATPWGVFLDSTLFREETGFKCIHLCLTEGHIYGLLRYWTEIRAWPRDQTKR
ncbi:hypothetical protein BJ684DRAFT_16855 [Piptocephalis cylindrospora]|uniref:NAD-dependent epimerase/dehydratase domain-containing protein n=1 Tax=Piptocephalis cylindrospora TaxID=1907219 RepID=A0A4P9Y1N9_9FUNG|nr:hypothetical protein BJ684DRAFT_16855 [Piptocephalis cylindrospora]|eukprot:RKP12685.1 hypothetical protein BJ684DRAFT_16855 [Piptocephalis cylindrospora]